MTITASLNLLLFITGFTSPALADKHGGYYEIYSRMLDRARLLFPEGQQPDITLTPVYCREDDVEYPPADPAQLGYDGILISGSPSDAFGPEPWIQRLVDWLREYRAKAVKMIQDRAADMADGDEKTPAEDIDQFKATVGIPRIVGICFGHQVLARAFGGKVTRNPQGWEVGYSVVDLTPLGLELLKPADSKTWANKTSMRINQMHQDVVIEIQPGFEILGGNANCTAQAVVSDDRTILSMQGHPEYQGEFLHDIVEVRRGLIFSDEFAFDVYEKLNNGHDGDAISSMILRFMMAGLGIGKLGESGYKVDEQQKAAVSQTKITKASTAAAGVAADEPILAKKAQATAVAAAAAANGYII
ncbi:class I glutamine amidotransferase-like protein [Ramicandelaber brevisporus]|nr:class I glutamine amidotransferase-like protein [Ramicandelaber brevisporus]